MLKPYEAPYKRVDDFCKGQPAVTVTPELEREMREYCRREWREFYGHAHGEADLIPGSHLDQVAAAIWGTAGEPNPGGLIWIHGLDRFLEVVHRDNLHYRFCG